MARLNEPLMSTDSLETLRRKFLRQNRDIARTNSTQSLKIRNLENECARLLSENLQLRSEVLRLKTDLEGSQARRVADHALQIKEKMEAQLVEWGAMLASLGHEPIPKNRSPRALKKARIQRDSIGGTRIADWRRRETMSSMQDLEAAALQEALCSEAEEGTDSPDLGPPPVSRFVDEDPVKFDLPTLTKLLKPALGESENNSLEDTYRMPVLLPSSPAKSAGMQDIIREEPKHQQIKSADEATKTTTESDLQAASQAAKANLKRKIREDEKENVPFSRPQLAGTATKSQPEKATSEKPKPTNRMMKELPVHKKDTREKSVNTTQRKPLGAKNSNETLGSPKKLSKAPVEGKGTKLKAESRGEEQAKDRLERQQDTKLVQTPPTSSSETVTRVDIEPESLSAEPNLVIPDSPEPSAPQREEMSDTPPPVDISSRGETARGSRRARAAISYAEPNLRDKMRRPNTKQLFDAVAGEGKNVRRISQCQKDEPSSLPSSVAKSAARSESSRKDALSQRAANDIYHDADIMASPLAQKTSRASTMEELPPSVTTDRKKKDAITTTQDSESDSASTAKPLMKGAHRRLEKIAVREAEVAKYFDDDEPDVYDFTESSPTDVSSKESIPEEKSSKTTKSGRQQRSRRLSSMASESLQLDDSNPSKPTGSRKRASMASIRSTRSELENNLREESFSSVDGDSSVSTVEGEETPTTTREKTNTRRRTTMI
ncbi:hypothetical protein FHL15_006322 [Xylaria flabelliformis]|uniref:Shugoshin C-terminal domain-containing protein n=1 Tax=Xylaria flabelliformis TaxID=2512241 RepID=A0A553HY80_9PEZI|nr:hypothetical protein FHL15_006322 [Xylaria flabelliformis]